MKSEKRGRGAVMGKLAILLLLAMAVMAVAVGCKDGDDDDGGDDNPIQDRSGTVKLFGGTSTVTVQVKGMTTKAEWDGIANKIAGRINDYYDTNPPQAQTTLKEMIDARSVIYIVEPNPIGYTKYKLTGDGKTIYIALSRIETTDVEDMLSLIYGNGTEVAKGNAECLVTRSA
jgi:hypothetical protein